MINKEYIALKNCKHGALYYIDARNFSIGIYDEDNQGFIGIRTKFTMQFLDLEYHWDIGAPHGTVKPFKILEQSPFSDLSIQRNIINNRDCYLEVYNWLVSKIDEIGEYYEI